MTMVRWTRRIRAICSLSAVTCAAGTSAVGAQSVHRLGEFIGRDMPFALDRNHFMGYPDDNLDLFEIEYVKTREHDALTVKPRIPYLELMRKGGPIVGVFAFQSVFAGNVVPELDLKLNNTTRKNVYVTSVRLSVRRSERIAEAIPVFDAFPGKDVVILTNYGWGEMRDPTLAIGIARLEDCQQGVGSVKTVRLRPLRLKRDTREDTFFANITGSDVPLSLKLERLVCAVGYLTYGDARGRTVRIPFATAVNRIHNPAYGPAPSLATYQVRLEPGRSGYTLDVPVSQSVAPQSTDYFKLRVSSSQSSTYEMGITVRTTDGRSLDLGTVQLEYFLAKGVKQDLDYAMYRRVDVKVSAPFDRFVHYVARSPEKPEEFVVFVTKAYDEDQTTQSYANVESFREAIVAELRKLSPRGSYCVVRSDGECTMGGGYGYR